jgi:hypothetical protein
MSIRRGENGFLRGVALVLGTGSMALFVSVSSFAAMPGQAGRAAAAKAAIPQASFPHMDAALGYLKAAHQQLKEGEPIFYGHRVKAMRHTEAAIADLEKGINDYIAAHPGTARSSATPEAPPSEAGDRFPRMRGAMQLLQQAEAQLNEGARLFNGERVAGLDETKAAISEIQAGMKDAAKGTK